LFMIPRGSCLARRLLVYLAMFNVLWFVLFADLFTPRVGVEVVRPGYCAVELQQILNAVFDPPGSLGVYGVVADDDKDADDKDALVIVGNGAGLEKIGCLLSRGPCGREKTDEQPLHILYLEHADAEAAARFLEHALPVLRSMGPVEVFADKATNSLIVQAEREDFEAVEAVVESLRLTWFGPEKVTLPRVLIDSLFAATGRKGGTLALYCHVVEGWSCFDVPADRIAAYDGMYDPEYEKNELPDRLADLLIMVIGPKYIEHARKNGVKLRCNRDEESGKDECAIDWGRGKGWEL